MERGGAGRKAREKAELMKCRVRGTGVHLSAVWCWIASAGVTLEPATQYLPQIDCSFVLCSVLYLANAYEYNACSRQ